MVVGCAECRSYLQCPKGLWLEVKRPGLIENSAATEASIS